MKVLNKLQMRQLYYNLEFGNRWSAWTGTDFLTLNDDPFEYYLLMYNGKPEIELPEYTAGGSKRYIQNLILHWVYQFNLNSDWITVTGRFQEPRIILQGEVQRSENYYDLFYSTEQLVMREALKKQSYSVDGLQAKLLLQSKLDTPSFDNLNSLFERFPDSVIEFTCYERSVGLLNWNTVFWEVRNY